MTQILLIGIAAGAAAALLFLAPVSGSALAFPLFALTGLPIAIAGLGWTALAAIAAAVVGAAVILALTQWVGAVTFLFLFAVPMVWLTRLANLSRPHDPSAAEGAHEWYPLGRLLFHAALVVAVGIVIVGVSIGYDPATLVDEITAMFVDWLAGEGAAAPPTAADLEPFVRLNVALLPSMLAILSLAMVVFDLWLAALVTRTSGRLRRPQERLWTANLPNAALFGLGGALAASLLPGALGEAGAVFAGALAGAVTLVGLAVLHALTIGMAGRRALLAVTYVLLVLSGLPLILFAIMGIGETFWRLRERRLGGASPS